MWANKQEKINSNILTWYGMCYMHLSHGTYTVDKYCPHICNWGRYWYPRCCNWQTRYRFRPAHGSSNTGNRQSRDRTWCKSLLYFWYQRLWRHHCKPQDGHRSGHSLVPLDTKHKQKLCDNSGIRFCNSYPRYNCHNSSWSQGSQKKWSRSYPPSRRWRNCSLECYDISRNIRRHSWLEQHQLKLLQHTRLPQNIRQSVPLQQQMADRWQGPKGQVGWWIPGTS